MENQEPNPLADLQDDANRPASVIDPVCGMEIDPADAVGTHQHKGTTYYFCNPSCLERFRADPESFLSPAGSPAEKKPAPAAVASAPAFHG